jgi:hypothetical protein
MTEQSRFPEMPVKIRRTSVFTKDVLPSNCDCQYSNKKEERMALDLNMGLVLSISRAPES